MDDIAIVEESVELLPEISKFLYATAFPRSSSNSLSPVQTKAVAYLYYQGDLTVSEMSKGLALSLPSTSELIDRLVDHGLVSKARDPADRRRAVVSLTAEAIHTATGIHDARRNQVRRALQLLPREQWPCFLESIRALERALRESASEGP